MIVKITSTASWQGDSGSCDNGLGDSPTSTGVGEISTGVKYEFYPVTSQSGDVEIDPYTPSASVTTGNSSGSCSVWFKVEVYEVRLALSGTVIDADEHFILIGQALGASLSIHPSKVALDAFPFDGGDVYTWSVDGGDPFKEWAILEEAECPDEIPQCTNLQHVAEHRPWQSENSKDMPKCYLAVPGGVTIEVEFDLVVLTDPGTVSLELTAEPPGIIVNEAIGTATLLPGGTPPTEGMRLHGVTVQMMTEGLWILARVETPAKYVDEGDPDYGKFCFNQTLSSVGGWIRDGYGDHLYDRNFTGPPRKLDELHPYAAGTDPQWFVADGNDPGFMRDSPGVNGSIVGYYAVRMAGAFQAVLMYLPPGGDAQLVPLRGWLWDWVGEASSWPSWGFTERSQSIASMIQYPPHPVWTGNLACFPGNYIPPD